ncbi:hypothetical protein M427DRAFT_63734 [Gonapodya prolifera JEL478]|uniref:Uncharacterized protein n=1 Tax=Gonapodya prolifera (strain JEL478) TaxID=1344416 RepID=A0A138ZZ18_GONPJ|nr:hypothetical protein M427DRAFT_63734 [Gonapodya prolifera JEL478]|eukprot:KXS09658.1 hypothetical protein M427DRAFT_63734 [Gonapodya prolifera JEL478]
MGYWEDESGYGHGQGQASYDPHHAQAYGGQQGYAQQGYAQDDSRAYQTSEYSAGYGDSMTYTQQHLFPHSMSNRPPGDSMQYSMGSFPGVQGPPPDSYRAGAVRPQDSYRAGSVPAQDSYQIEAPSYEPPPPPAFPPVSQNTSSVAVANKRMSMAKSSGAAAFLPDEFVESRRLSIVPNPAALGVASGSFLLPGQAAMSAAGRQAGSYDGGSDVIGHQGSFSVGGYDGDESTRSVQSGAAFPSFPPSQRTVGPSNFGGNYEGERGW